MASTPRRQCLDQVALPEFVRRLPIPVKPLEELLEAFAGDER